MKKKTEIEKERKKKKGKSSKINCKFTN